MTHARQPLSLALSLGLVALPACGSLTPQTTDTGADATGASDTDASETENTPTEGMSSTVTIYQIQKGEIPEKTLVDLKGEIVTSPIFYDKKGNGNFFISEAPGGPFSGIQVYVYADTMAALDAEGKLPAIGDKIDIRGTYSEFFGYSEITMDAAGDMTILGQGVVPAPSVVTAVEAKTEDYEGCLVQIAGAKVTQPVAMYGQFEVDGALQVDDLFFIPNPGPKPPVDTTFTNLVGQMYFSFDIPMLVPRFCADYQGWDCTTPVDPTDTTTGGNVAATIYEIQMGAVPEKSYVDLEKVVVTSPFILDKKMNGNFFIAESGGGEYSGIQVYVYADVAAALAGKTPKLGDVLTISGQYVEQFNASQLVLSKVDNIEITGTYTVPDPTIVAPADIAVDGPKAEPYEGVLVQVENVTVTEPVLMYGEFKVTGDLIVDDLFFVPNPGPKPAKGDKYTSITGLLAYSFDFFKLSPRDLADLKP